MWNYNAESYKWFCFPVLSPSDLVITTLFNCKFVWGQGKHNPFSTNTLSKSLLIPLPISMIIFLGSCFHFIVMDYSNQTWSGVLLTEYNLAFLNCADVVCNVVSLYLSFWIRELRCVRLMGWGYSYLLVNSTLIRIIIVSFLNIEWFGMVPTSLVYCKRLVTGLWG